jgi:hypothetical protein
MRGMSIEDWISGRDNGEEREDTEAYVRYTRVRPGTLPYAKRPDGKTWDVGRRR